MLDRIELELKTSKTGILNYNYNYKIMNILYQAMTLIDEAKTLQLHDTGYIVDTKKFKLFNFALVFKNANFTEAGIEINSDSKISLILSGKSDILNLILKGFIKMQEFQLDNFKFKIIGTVKDKSIKFKKQMLYKAASQVIESKYEAETKKINYLNPMDKGFYETLAQNLKRKYEAVYNKEYDGELFFDIDNMLKIKKKLLQVKENGFLLGYGKFEIWIEAEPEMQKIAYYLGIGQNNSLGNGFLTYITGRGVK